MFCKNCGMQIEDGEKFCKNCGASQETENTVNVNTEYNQNNQNQSTQNVQSSNVGSTSKDSNKVYKVLSYIGILWIVGLLCKEKDDPSVRFHVGQGIIATICSAIIFVVVELLNNLLIANIFKEKIWGITIGVSPTGLALIGFLNFAASAIAIVFEVMGIINAVKGKDKELPIIGSHAFYK